MISHWIWNYSQPSFDSHQSCTQCLPESCCGCTKGLAGLWDSYQACMDRWWGHRLSPSPRWGLCMAACGRMFCCKLNASSPVRSRCGQAVGGEQLREAGGRTRAASSLSWHELTTSPLQAATTMATTTDTLKMKWIRGPASKESIFYPCCSQKARLHSKFVVSLLKAPGHSSASLI